MNERDKKGIPGATCGHCDLVLSQDARGQVTSVRNEKIQDFD